MKFDKLRLTGFKSFVEPTEFAIQPGLTGVVGPNGCGKSNLVEALRWVMGENAYKQMRASSMDDVIFSGSGSRPARNHAEVMLVLDNSARTAPAAFNDSDILEITRRIEREEGSTYKLNGREVRARDVQLLFADASSGARSPALVRQGQIGEIISAKPQARRRILEEAAGIGGLHSRRHEAELRLKGAEENLVRLEDVLGQIGAQTESLRRQARQAARYRALAAEIRRHEALVALIALRGATKEAEETKAAVESNVLDVAEATRNQAETARLQAIAALEAPKARDAESQAGAALQRLILAREALEGEEKRAQSRRLELERRFAQLSNDMGRETHHFDDAAAALERLLAEEEDLSGAGEDEADLAEEARLRCEEAEARLKLSEAALEAAQNAFAGVEAQRNALADSARREEQAFARYDAELNRLIEEIEALRDSAGEDSEFAEVLAEAERLMDAAAQAEEDALAAESALALARDEETFLRNPLKEAERKAQALETEARTLSNLLRSEHGAWPAVIEEIVVEKGFEGALGAALGEDLQASTDDEAPAFWAHSFGLGDPALPDEAIRPVRQGAGAGRAEAASRPDRRGPPRKRPAAAKPPQAGAAAGLRRGRPVALGRFCPRRRGPHRRRAPPEREEPARRPRSRGEGRARRTFCAARAHGGGGKRRRRGGRGRPARPRRRAHGAKKPFGGARGRQRRRTAPGPVAVAAVEPGGRPPPRPGHARRGAGAPGAGARSL